MTTKVWWETEEVEKRIKRVIGQLESGSFSDREELKLLLQDCNAAILGLKSQTRPPVNYKEARYAIACLISSLANMTGVTVLTEVERPREGQTCGPEASTRIPEIVRITIEAGIETDPE